MLEYVLICINMLEYLTIFNSETLDEDFIRKVVLEVPTDLWS